ncbi:MAG: GNAT family N-acetyltransferase [Candidatus Pacebacteria bacterium]|nr:GNAT family N-acetyltransferase [Candidatus Paceibacterota bacterium]
MNPILVLPSIKYKDSFLSVFTEYHDGKLIDNFNQAKYSGDFSEFLEKIENEREGKFLEEGKVPQTIYWLVDGDKFIGRVGIRHVLNDQLLKEGGHIGYSIRPSERMKGYGSVALQLALLKAKDLGIDKALLTCNADNIGSRKIIEKNGGVFENQIENKLRFWIATA